MKILLRLGADLTVKSDKIRVKFMNRLVQNIQSALKDAGIRYSLIRQWSRMFVETDDARALDILSRVFGIASPSQVEHQCPPTIDDIVRTGAAAYQELVRGKSFAVRARRVGDHSFTSMDMARALGAALAPFAAKVDLGSPEVEVSVEVRNDDVYFFSSKIPGPGGLPLGVSGKVLCLMSGGFDSAVAAWMMQKRGLDVEYLFCNLAGAAYERSVLSLAKFLAAEWSHGTKPKLHVVDFMPVAEAIRLKVKPSHAQVILKRMFYRVADRLAAECHAEALVTGECIGQVSSQTLRNLCTIEEVTARPIFRPVVGLDKEEILRFAKRIGTYDLSAGIQEYCQLVPDKPVTGCRPDSAAREEQDFDFNLLDQALATRRTLTLKELSASDLVMPYLYVSELPDEAVIIDCRPAAAFDGWHHPAAQHCELHVLLTDFRSYDKQRRYVLYCPVGLQSAVAAEKMQKAGFEAYSFKGGAPALHAFVMARDAAESALS